MIIYYYYYFIVTLLLNITRPDQNKHQQTDSNHAIYEQCIELRLHCVIVVHMIVLFLSHTKKNINRLDIIIPIINNLCCLVFEHQLYLLWDFDHNNLCFGYKQIIKINQILR